MTKLAQAAKRIRSACPHHIITSWQDRIVMPFAISTSFLPLTPRGAPPALAGLAICEKTPIFAVC
jgi:hypothetical protein